MQKHIFLIILALIFGSCKFDSNKEQKTEEKSEIFTTLEGGEVCYTIGDHYAGEFIIGEEVPKQEYLENFTIRKDKTTKSIEGEKVTEIRYSILKDEEELLLLIPTINNDQLEIVQEIEVVSDKYKTSFGITVGSELEEFVSAYPEYKIWYSYVGDICVIESPEIQAQFLLSKEDLTGKIENTNDVVELNVSDFKPNSKIRKIRLI